MGWVKERETRLLGQILPKQLDGEQRENCGMCTVTPSSPLSPTNHIGKRYKLVLN